MIYKKNRNTGKYIPIHKYMFLKPGSGKKATEKKFSPLPKNHVTIKQYSNGIDICIDMIELKKYLDLIPCQVCRERIRLEKLESPDTASKRMGTKATATRSNKNGVLEMDRSIGKNCFSGRVVCNVCGTILEITDFVKDIILRNVSEITAQAESIYADSIDINQTAEEELTKKNKREIQKASEMYAVDMTNDNADPLDSITLDEDEYDEGGIK